MSLSLRARAGAFAASVAAATVALSLVAAPAWAHDELVASSPQQDEQLTVAPTSVELTFSAEIMEMGAAVIVADAQENDWVAGDIQIDFDTLTVPLNEGMPNGAYEIRWRVVSSDGHPISGLIPFTVDDPAAASPAPTTAPSAVSSPTPTADQATGGPSDDATAAALDSAAEDGGIARAVLIGAIGAASALALFGLVLFFLRGRARRARRGSDEEPPKP
ncbi:copper resistance CopC family protein [Microbacterium sp. UBA837]|uniref:copper resistance CopC family protein n=1 Tax=Microbacterium sp. UBA837 TaxID=1946956 RepID=UPI0025E7D834|nr:copper resistance CopC family protein [Microbacterium sp. UBA837]